MRRFLLAVAIPVTTALVVSLNPTVAQDRNPSAKPDWSLNATIIEACSCPMFCQCYFNPRPLAPSGHEGHGDMADHYCMANFVYRVNKGHYGAVKLDGLKFWLAGDLGGDLSEGKTDWAEITFEPSTTKEQRSALALIMSHVYPFKWRSFSVSPADATVDWQATKDRAEARLNGGKNGEVVLRRYQGMTDDPIVIKNIKYFGAPRNEGLLMMPNEIEAYRVGDKPFEFKGTNGLMVTIDISSKDMK